MRSRVDVVAIPSEIGEFSEEVRRVFVELGRVFGPDLLAGECTPTLDVYETDETVEIVVDLPGVERSAVRVLRKGEGILIAGEKPARRVLGESTFHLVERGYGRFARVVRVTRSCDMSRADAVLEAGELRISLPKIQDRRGATRPIAVRARE